MSDYTPTTEDVRRDYSIDWSKDRGLSKKRQDDFTRWLAAHDAEKRAEWEAKQGMEYTPCGIGPCAAPDGHEGTCAQASGWDKFTDDAKDAAFDAGYRAALAEQGETEWEVEHGLLVKIGGNWAETEWEPEQFNEVVAGYPHNEYVRAERKVTPWLPVPGSTVRESDSGVRDSDNEESEGKA